MSAMRQMGLLSPLGQAHLCLAFESGPITAKKNKSLIMIALTRSLNQFGRALGVVGAAISQAAAIRITHQPDVRKTARAD